MNEVMTLLLQGFIITAGVVLMGILSHKVYIRLRYGKKEKDG